MSFGFEPVPGPIHRTASSEYVEPGNLIASQARRVVADGYTRKGLNTQAAQNSRLQPGDRIRVGEPRAETMAGTIQFAHLDRVGGEDIWRVLWDDGGVSDEPGIVLNKIAAEETLNTEPEPALPETEGEEKTATKVRDISSVTDAPTQQPMRPSNGEPRRNISTDQKKVRRRMTRQAVDRPEDGWPPHPDPDGNVPSPGWGQTYGSAPYRHGDTGEFIWLYRKGQRCRWFDADNNQVGPEQANVAPALAWALSNGYFNFENNMQWGPFDQHEASAIDPSDKKDDHDQSGQGVSSLDPDEDDDPMWPWLLGEKMSQRDPQEDEFLFEEQP